MTRPFPPLSAAVLALVVVMAGGSAFGQECSGWQPVPVSAAPTKLQATAWADGKFWAFGNDVYVSDSGLAWVRLGAGPDMDVIQVRRLGGTFVAVGRYARLATSGDGLTWTETLHGMGGPPDTQLNDVVWSGSTYVAVGFYATESSGADGYPLVFVSPDLVNWTTVDPPAGGGYREELDGIVWTGSRFVAIGSNNWQPEVLVSNDGRSWTRIAGPGGAGVSWNGQELVAVGGSLGTSGNSAPAVWRSADGISWQSTTIAQGYGLSAVTWEGSRFVAVGRTSSYAAQALILTSPDAAAWGQNETTVFDTLVAVTSHLGTTVAVGRNGTILTQNCPGREPIWVPAAAHLAGVNGSQWRTDLEVFNPGEAQIGYTVELLARDADNSVPVARSFALGPGRSQRHMDALALLFSFTGAATLRITPIDGQLMTNARTYDDAPTGTYGQFVEGRPASAAITTGVTARMIHVSQAADRTTGFRTNLGLINASSVETTVVADLFRADGTQLGEVSVTLRPFESVQRTEIFREVTADAVADGYIAVKTTTYGAAFFAYASVIDNRSNDPVYMPAR